MTQKQADIVFQQEQFFLTGELLMANVMSVRNKSLKAFAAQQDLIVDFSQLKSCDSSGLALLLDWVSFAKQTHRKIRFRRVLPEMMSIVAAAGLGSVLLPYIE